MIFLFFGERGKRGKGFGVANVNWGFERSASYQQVTSKLEGELDGGGIKVEFGGFIGGFGKIFFTKGGIKREKEGFWGRWKGEVIFFLKSFFGWEENSKFYGEMYFLGFGLSGRWDVIWNIP